MTNEQLIQTVKEAMRNDTVLQRGIVDLLCQALTKSDEQVRQLTEQRDAVVAEFAKFKTAQPQPFGPEMMKALEAYEWHQDDVPETGILNAFFILRDSIAVETPATSAILDSLRAEGVEMLATFAGEEYQRCAKMNKAEQRKWKGIVHLCVSFARQLRESKGAQS